MEIMLLIILGIGMRGRSAETAAEQVLLLVSEQQQIMQ
jgi:hypothetical protein